MSNVKKQRTLPRKLKGFYALVYNVDLVGPKGILMRVTDGKSF